MFVDCPALESAPALPTTELAKGCYFGLFSGCTSLKEAPELPATVLTEKCYYVMFYKCTSLEEAPELPATELADRCYYGMFYGCSSLKHIKVGFKDWTGGMDATYAWVYKVPETGNFECPEGLEIKYGHTYIPTGWSVNGAAPAATKSLATQAPALIDAESSAARNRKHSAPQELKPREISPLKPISL